MNKLTKTSPSNPTEFCVNCFSNFGNLSLDESFYDKYYHFLHHLQQGRIKRPGTRRTCSSVARMHPASCLHHLTISSSSGDGKMLKSTPLQSMVTWRRFWCQRPILIHCHLLTPFSIMLRRTSPYTLMMKGRI